jgi:hypothetical protein
MNKTFKYLFAITLAAIVLMTLSLNLLAEGRKIKIGNREIELEDEGVEFIQPTGLGLPSKAEDKMPLDAAIGPNTRANSRETCGANGITQSETAAAAYGNVVVVAFNDTRGRPGCMSGHAVIGWAYSLDYGQTFTDGGNLPTGFDSGDPWLGVGPDGTFYLLGIWQRTQAIGFIKGNATETGFAWGSPVVLNGGVIHDKPAMTVDPASGNIYISYTALIVGIQVRRSTDGGNTWGAPVNIPNTFFTGAQGSYPVVGPNGEVYVGFFTPLEGAMKVSKSTDQGRTFSAPVTAAGPACGFSIPGLNRPDLQLQLLVLPSLAVDTSGGDYNGNVYLAYQSGCGTPGKVYVARSENGGTSWSTSVQANNDTTTGIHFFPSVAVNSLGQVYVTFYDRRENPGTQITNVYIAQSVDGGRSFPVNTRITDVASDWSTSRSDATPNFGDYIYTASYGPYIMTTWADSREGDPDAYFAWVAPIE